MFVNLQKKETEKSSQLKAAKPLKKRGNSGG